MCDEQICGMFFHTSTSVWASRNIQTLPTHPITTAPTTLQRRHDDDYETHTRRPKAAHEPLFLLWLRCRAQQHAAVWVCFFSLSLLWKPGFSIFCPACFRTFEARSHAQLLTITTKHRAARWFYCVCVHRTRNFCGRCPVACASA